MLNRRSILEERQTRSDFFAKASLDQIVKHSKTGHFLRDSVICTGEQLGECVYLVLNGRCEHRWKSREIDHQVIQAFRAGEVFGGMIDGLPERLRTEVVAVQDSVVLAMRMDDLVKAEAENPIERIFDEDKLPDSNTTFFFSASNRRVVGFVFLSDLLPSEKISENIASQLRAESEQDVLLVELLADTVGRPSTPGEFDHELDGMASLPGDIHRDEFGVHRLRLRLPAEPPDPDVLGELFRKLRRRFRSVIFAVQAGRIPASYLSTSVLKATRTCFFLRPDADDLYRLDLLLHELRPQMTSPVPPELKPVLCIAPGQTAGTFDEQIVNIGIPAPHFIRSCPQLAQRGSPIPETADEGLYHGDIRHIARDLNECLVGLALSSGGAKGFAHIGVIQVLEENGLDVDVVAGASMGAYVGSIWSHGHDGERLEALAREMEGKRAMWSLIDPVIFPWQGILRGFAVKRRLQKSIGAAQFADLPRTFRAVAAHLDTMERKVFATGEVASAVHASIAVPGICIPVRVDGEVYIDGGIVDPVPTDVLQEMGVRKIIAVNTIPTPERIHQCLQIERELARLHPEKSRSFIRKLLPSKMYINHYTDGNVLEILMHSTHGAQMRLAEASSRRADVTLRPDICDDRWMDFRNPGLYIKAGREVALRHLDEIKTLIKGKEASHEVEPAARAMAAIV